MIRGSPPGGLPDITRVRGSPPGAVPGPPMPSGAAPPPRTSKPPGAAPGADNPMDLFMNLMSMEGHSYGDKTTRGFGDGQMPITIFSFSPSMAPGAFEDVTQNGLYNHVSVYSEFTPGSSFESEKQQKDIGRCFSTHTPTLARKLIFE